MLPPLHPEGDPRQTAVEPAESPDFSRELVDPIGYPEMNPTKKTSYLVEWVYQTKSSKQMGENSRKNRIYFDILTHFEIYTARITMGIEPIYAIVK